jgi:small subunit ribosomal protein S2
MSTVSMKELLEAGAHFGHQTRRWNPKMKPYIYGSRNGIYILNLKLTLDLFRQAAEAAAQLGRQGRTLLFVGTKRQARDVVQQEAGRCGMPYVTERWPGGMLTNFDTMRRSVGLLKELEGLETSSRFAGLTKKERLRLAKEREKLLKLLAGVRDMSRLPDAVFIIDPAKEHIAVEEAARLNIPIIALVDTNCDPDPVRHVIPSNDDAIRAIKLFTSRLADAYLAGRGMAKDVVVETPPPPPSTPWSSDAVQRDA